MALDRTTGGTKWSVAVAGGSPAIGRDGTVYVGAKDGKLYALQGSSGLAPSPWPKSGGDARNTSSHQHAGPPLLLPLVTNQLAGVRFPFALEIVADGAQPLSYTWFFNGAPLRDLTNATLAFASFDETNAGIYRLRVTNILGSVDSSDIVLAAGAEIAVDVIGPGHVTRSPSGHLQPLGTSVELEAQPDDGQWFLGWTGDLQDTNRVLRFTADRSLHLQATFGRPPGTLKWVSQPGGPPILLPSYFTVASGSPAIGPDGTLYVFNKTLRTCMIYAVDPGTGAKKWEAGAPYAPDYAVVGDDGTVYVISNSGSVYAFDGATGDFKWSASAKMGITLGVDGTIFTCDWFAVFGLDVTISALDSATGRQKWAFPCGIQAHITSPPILGSEGNLYLNFGNTLYSQNSTTGVTNWANQFDGFSTTSPALGADGTLFVGTSSGKLIALKGTDGAVKWESALDAGVSAAPSLGTDGTVFVGTTAGTLYALDPLTGNPVWVSPTANPIYVPPAISAGGTVYVTGASNKLFAFEAKTGGKKWEYTSSERLGSAPAIGADGTVYVAQNGILWALQGDRELADSAWPKYQGNARNTGAHTPSGPPRMLTQTPSQMVGIGRPFSLEVLTDGARPQVFAWYFNGIQLTNMAGSSLAFASFDPTKAGTYQVRVTNALGRVESQEMRLTAGGQLSVEIVGPGQVTGLPAGSIVPLGTPIELQAQPQADRRFLGWSGDFHGTNNPLRLTLERSLHLRATFETRPGELLWSLATGASMREFCPAIGSDGTVYGAGNGRVFALDGMTGTKRWDTPIFSKLGFSAPEIGFDGAVYISSDDGNLYALDAATEAILWTFPSGFAWNTSFSSGAFALGVDGTIYLGSATNNVSALDGKSGRLKWVFPTQHPVFRTPVIGYDNTVFAIESQNGSDANPGSVRLSALNGETGALRWAFITNDVFMVLAPGADGTVYVSSWSGTIYALDSAFGTLKWSCAAGGFLGSSVSIGEDGTFFATATDQKIYAFNGASGAKLWEAPTGDPVAPTPTVGSDGTVYLAAADSLYALDGASGTKQWEYQVPIGGPAGGPMSSPALGAQGILYLWCQGVFYAVQGNSGLAHSSWPKSLGNARNNGNVANPSAGPQLIVPPRQILDELATLRVTNTVVGLDPATNSLSFALLGAPEGVRLEPATGILTWTPDETQGPGDYVLTVMVSNSVAPFLMLTNHFTVVVRAMNRPPTLVPIANQLVDELTTLTVTNRASDVNIVANLLSFEVVTAPAGVVLDRASGVLSWTPTEVQGPSTNAISVKVFYNDEPSLSATQSFQVRVNEVNQAPHLTTAIRNLTVYGGQKLVFTNTATDADWPTNVLAFLLDSDAPTGAQLDRITGVFRWTAPAVTAPQTDRFTVWVTDNGEPWKSDSGIFTVVTSPAPVGPRLLNVEGSASGVLLIRWQTTPGARYQLQSTARLDPPAWVSAGDILTATGQTASQSEPIGADAQRYYRVLKLED